MICHIVRQALVEGYLTLEDEDRLRYLLQETKYGREDFQAFHPDLL